MKPLSHGTSRLVFLLISLLVLLPIAAGTLHQVSAQSEEAGEDSLYKHLSVFTEVLSLIQRGYVDETSLARLFAGAFEGTTDALDPLATYVPAPDVERYADTLEIGSGHSGLSVAREAGISYVVAVEKGSPGALADIEFGDVVAEIDDKSTREMPLWELQTLLAAASGSVRLELLRRGQTVETELALGAFEPVASDMRVEGDVPILEINGFLRATPSRVRELLLSEPAQSSPRLVVDVRGSAGGVPSAAFDVAALFVRGALGELRARDEVVQAFASDLEPVWTGRLAVLSNRSCQGACEVFLAAVRESPDIESVGSRTFGHAGRLSSIELSSGASLFFTDAFYAGPEGDLIDSGLEPEVRVDAVRQTLGASDSETEDPVLKRALEILSEDAVEEQRRAA